MLNWIPNLQDRPIGPIDAVVTWVDGSDPAHMRKRKRALQAMTVRPAKRGSVARRFTDNGEIRLCLRSLHNYAPWLRTIWLVTDNQVPKWLDLAAAERAGIRVIDHAHIFRGYEEYLPTFNSLSIESMLGRIEGLADRFVYFNDDMFLTNPVEVSDFFTEDHVYIRGRWEDFSQKPINFFVRGQLNAGEMLGFSREQHFVTTHVTYAMLRPVLTELFERFKPEFLCNAAYPFRDIKQFQLLSLHNYYVLSTSRGIVKSGNDMVHFSLQLCNRGSVEDIRDQLDRLGRPDIIAGCVNYAEVVVPKVPDLFTRLGEIAGPPAPFERV